MEELCLPSVTAEDIKNYKNWWNRLSGEWKLAYNEVYANTSSQEILPDETLHAIWNSTAIRFAGPRAMHRNMSFELTDLSGIIDLKNLKIVVVINQNISSIAGIANLENLESLFIFDNQITDINDIAGLVSLKEFYFQSNLVESLRPLENLHKLQTVYCTQNRISKLEGINSLHSDTLMNFHCIPNELLRDREIIAFESRVGIRCKKG